jgi:hypothetical protein
LSTLHSMEVVAERPGTDLPHVLNLTNTFANICLRVSDITCLTGDRIYMNSYNSLTTLALTFVIGQAHIGQLNDRTGTGLQHQRASDPRHIHAGETAQWHF